MNHKIIRFIPVIFWMVFIFFLSSRSTTGIPIEGTSRFLLMKTLHLIEYTLLAILFNFGNYNLKTNICFAYVFACSDEFHQLFVPGREGKFTDTLIDLLGISFGTVISYFLRKKRIF